MIRHGVDLSAITSGISFGGIGVDPVIHGAITAHGLDPARRDPAGHRASLASFYPACARRGYVPRSA